MIQPGERLRFGEGELATLGRELRDMLTDLERQHEEMFDRLRMAWSWYEAEKGVEVKNVPIERASNVVVPVVRIHCDATHSRYAVLLKATEDVWTGRSRSEEFAATGLDRHLPAFLNWAARHEFDFDGASSDWTQEIINTGSGVLALGWDTEEMGVQVPRRKGVTKVIVRDGPVLEHVPREHCLWDQNYRAWDAPLFARRSLLTWPDIIQRVNGAGWDWEVAQRIKRESVQGADAGLDVSLEKVERGGMDPDRAPEAYRLYDIREVWIDWPVAATAAGITAPKEMEEGDEVATIVVFLHRGTGRILLATAKPYTIVGKPFYDAYFRKRSGAWSSEGLAFVLRDVQETMSTLVNQAIDSVTIANSIRGATSDPNLAKARFELNKLQFSMQAKDVYEFGKGKNVMPDLTLMGQMNVIAERLTGISDPALGREMRMGGHPAPATSTLSLLQEGKKLDIPAIRSIRQCLQRVGTDLLLLYQQHFSPTLAGRVVRAIGREDGTRVAQWLGAPGGEVPELDLAAISETMNPDVERQKALANFQMTANFYALVSQYLQVVANPQAPQALKGAMLQGLEALQASFQKVLENNDADDIRTFILDLGQLERAVGADARAAQGAAGQSPLGAAARAVGSPAGGNGTALGSGLG